MPAALYLCLDMVDFAAEAVVRTQPELRGRAVALLGGRAPLEYVFAANARARRLGIATGMKRLEAESFAHVAIVQRDREQEDRAFAELMEAAGRFSPRIEALAAPAEALSRTTLMLDVSGSEKLLGSPGEIAAAVARQMRALGFEAAVAVSYEATAALVAARGGSPVSVIAAGDEALALAPLPVAVLDPAVEQGRTLEAWGIRTLGQLAALPQKALAARLGTDGHRLQLMARGIYPHLLRPDEADPLEALRERVELEHPVELLEPLLFLLGRSLEEITQRAAAQAMAIAEVGIELELTESAEAERVTRHSRRTVRPALPEQGFHVLLKLVQLELELHPPGAPIRAFTLAARAARRPRVQQGLFAPQSPEAGKLEVLVARLRKLVGDERVGAPELLDTHAAEAFRVGRFGAHEEQQIPRCARDDPGKKRNDKAGKRDPLLALRAVRPPRAVRVGVRDAVPQMLMLDGERMAVVAHAGPWRTDGAWWTARQWAREEWDVEIEAGRCLRLAFDPGAECWYVTGVYD